MINFKFDIINPWCKPSDTDMNNFYYTNIKLSENKNFEMQITKCNPDSIFEVEVNLVWWGSDHAGPSFDIELLGYCFNIQVYDRRHWNYETNDWKVSKIPDLDLFI